MANNTTDFNIAFHNDYKNSNDSGLRVPIDDRGVESNRDRPFALGSNDPLWSLGSANKAVKEMHDFNNGSVSQLDQYNYDNGLMDNDDFGRFRESADITDMYKFRTPTLLNVEVV